MERPKGCNCNQFDKLYSTEGPRLYINTDLGMIMCNFHYVKKWVLGKFKNFSIAQNLRKIEFGDYRIAKSTTLTRGSEF